MSSFSLTHSFILSGAWRPPGDSEQMLLSSRDKKDMFVVSFSDIRRCLEASFTELHDQAVRY